jgi:glutathione S-transferase
VHVNLPEGEHNGPVFLAQQRYGQVPLLVDNRNGRRLCQSAAILEYLADTTGRFGGADLDERIRAREWMYWDFDRLAPPVYRARSIRLGIRAGGPEIVEMCAREGNGALKVLDRHLAGRGFVAAESPTIADIDLYGVVAFAGEAGFDLAPYENLLAWKARVEALPGFGTNLQILPQANRAAA